MPATPGLDHQGVLYRDAAELVALVAPVLAAAAHRGAPVAAIVDEPTERRLREHIGAGADRIVFTDPAVAFAAPVQTMVAQRRREAAQTVQHSGSLTVVGQFQPWMAADDVAFWECLFNLVLAELPVTLLCACPTTAGAAAGIVGETHPRLRTAAGPRVNDRFRPPLRVLAEHPQPVPPTLGLPVGERTFTAAADLAPLRTAVTAYAQVVGLDEIAVDAAVLAVSEAATNCLEHGAGHGTLQLWTTGSGLTWEVHDPGRPGAPPDHSPARLGLLPLGPLDRRGRGTWVIRELCDSLHVWSNGGGTSVRGSIGR